MEKMVADVMDGITVMAELPAMELEETRGDRDMVTQGRIPTSSLASMATGRAHLQQGQLAAMVQQHMAKHHSR